MPLAADSTPTCHAPAAANAVPDRVDPAQVWRMLRHNGRRIGTLAVAGALLALLATSVIPRQYVARSTLLPSQTTSPNNAIATLIGLPTPYAMRGPQIVALASSQQLALAVIREQNLLPVLFAERWDAQRNIWRGTLPDRLAALFAARAATPRAPTYMEAWRRFRGAYSISTDGQTGVITVALKWYDAELTARWTNALVTRLDAELRARAKRQAQTSLERYRKTLLSVSPAGETIDLLSRQALQRLLETAQADLARAEADPNFAFEVIDAALVPDRPVQPWPALLGALGAALGTAIGLLVAILREGPRAAAKTVPPPSAL